MSTIPVILDVDTGVDDAIAMMLASTSDSIEIRAITTCFGNCAVELSTLNTLKVAELLGIEEVPVAKGAKKGILSLLSSAVRGRSMLGADGFGNTAENLPYPRKSPDPLSAVDLMAKELKESPRPVVICALGPLTNIAVLLLSHPELKSKIGGIAIAAGAIFGGDVLPSVEFNAGSDPEAMQIVLNSGLKLFFCSLDASMGACAMFEDRERFRMIGGNVGDKLYDPLKKCAGYYEQKMLRDGCPLTDTAVVAWLMKPDLFTMKPYHVEVDLGGRYTRGATVVDVDGVSGLPENAVVATAIEREGFMKLITDAFRTYRNV